MLRKCFLVVCCHMSATLAGCGGASILTALGAFVCKHPSARNTLLPQASWLSSTTWRGKPFCSTPCRCRHSISLPSMIWTNRSSRLQLMRVHTRHTCWLHTIYPSLSSGFQDTFTCLHQHPASSVLPLQETDLGANALRDGAWVSRLSSTSLSQSGGKLFG